MPIKSTTSKQSTMWSDNECAYFSVVVALTMIAVVTVNLCVTAKLISKNIKQ
jgi:hypothetical protein